MTAIFIQCLFFFFFIGLEPTIETEIDYMQMVCSRVIPVRLEMSFAANNILPMRSYRHALL